MTSTRGQYEIFVFDTYKGDDLERAFRPYHIGTHVSSQSPRARLSCVVVVVVGQSESSLESVAVRSFML